MLFSRRLKQLGFSSYEEYLLSDHWSVFKTEYLNSGLPRSCAVCGDFRYELHHHTYKNLGREKLSDATPLCREHHEAVHDWLREHKKPVEWTADWVYMTKQGKTLHPQQMRALRKDRVRQEKIRKQNKTAAPIVTKSERTPEQLERDRQEFVALKRRYDQAIEKGRTHPKIPVGYEPDSENLVLLQMFVGLLTKPR